MENPYLSPSSNLGGQESFSSANGGVTQGVVSQLARTKGWVRFMSVLMYICAGMMILGGVVMLAAGSQVRSAGAPVAAVAVFYIIMAIFYIYPAVKLGAYATAIARLIATGGVGDLENALDQQRAFWKFVGIMMIVMFGLMIIAGLGGFLTAASMMNAR